MTAPERGPQMSQHPDLVEMQRQYSGILGGPQTVVTEGLLMLVGAFTAISPWVVNFQDSEPLLAVNNLILGLIIAAMGLGITGTPERSGGSSWAAVPIGIWLIIATWVMTTGSPSAGVIWSNIIVGALSILLGAAVAGLVLKDRLAKK